MCESLLNLELFLKENDTFVAETTLLKMFFPPLKIWVYSKKNEIAPEENFFPFREDTFLKSLVYRQSFVSFAKKKKNGRCLVYPFSLK